MKKSLGTLLVLLACSLYSQKQGNIWHFGKYCGLDFNFGSPIAISGGQTASDVLNFASQEGTACISDSAGKLLFYTGGKTIWNRFHQPMPNGTGIKGGASATQAALIVPMPGNDSLFYVFTSDEFQSFYAPAVSQGYRYSVVNMCLEGGKGDVVAGKKNILLMDTATEKLSACRDAAGTGYWIVGHKMFSREFRAWHLTSGGITNTVSSSQGILYGWSYQTNSWNKACGQSQMKLNAQGTQIAFAIGNFDPGYVEVFDFNSTTGVVSNACHMVIDSAIYKRVWGVEFSPDGSKLYISGSGGSGGNRLYQFNMLAGSCQAIRASQTIVWWSNTVSKLFSLEMGPDKKIYAVTMGNKLGRINSPNLAGPACNFDSLAITITGTVAYALPAFVSAFNYSNNLVDCCTSPQLTATAVSTIICAGQQTTLTAIGAGSYTWSNGLNGNSITVSPTVTTSYVVNGSNSAPGSCMRSSVLTVSVSKCTGIEDLAAINSSIKLYPNPGNGEFQVESGAPISSLAIFDFSGKKIISKGPLGSGEKFHIHEPGIYLVRIEVDGVFIKRSLIIE